MSKEMSFTGSRAILAVLPTRDWVRSVCAIAQIRAMKALRRDLSGEHPEKLDASRASWVLGDTGPFSDTDCQIHLWELFLVVPPQKACTIAGTVFGAFGHRKDIADCADWIRRSAAESGIDDSEFQGEYGEVMDWEGLGWLAASFAGSFVPEGTSIMHGGGGDFLAALSGWWRAVCSGEPEPEPFKGDGSGQSVVE